MDLVDRIFGVSGDIPKMSGDFANACQSAVVKSAFKLQNNICAISLNMLINYLPDNKMFSEICCFILILIL